ncbi:HAD hydrolase-like protein [Streptococcus suis]
MYQTILFDLDGTLTDSGQGILNSVAYALEKMGIEEPDTANLNRFIGHAINQLEAFPNHAVMIGDREHDIEGARRHQLPAIGVLYGYGSKQEFEKAGATMIVETVQDLKRVLLTTE